MLWSTWLSNKWVTFCSTSRSTDSRLLLRQWQLPLQNVRNQAKPKWATGGRRFSSISVREAHFEINLRTLAQGMWDLQIFKNTQNGGQKAGLSSTNKAKLANLDMCHRSARNIFLLIIYLNSQIFGTSQCAIRREKCRDALLKAKPSFRTSQ